MKKLILTTAEWLYLKWILERNMIRMDADAFRLKEGEPGSGRPCGGWGRPAACGWEARPLCWR